MKHVWDAKSTQTDTTTWEKIIATNDKYIMR